MLSPLEYRACLCVGLSILRFSMEHVSMKIWIAKKNLYLKAFRMALKPNYKNLAPTVATNAHTRNNYNLRNFPNVFRK